MGFMRPLQAILYVADHKYANTWYFAHEYYRYDTRHAALSQYWLADCCQNGLFFFLRAWIFEVKLSLGSMLQLCNDTVLPMVCTERWVSQICITDLIYMQTPFQTQILE